MNGEEMLDIIGEVKGKFVMEAQSHRKNVAAKKRLSLRKSLMLAAIIAMLLMLAGCVAYVLRLDDLKMGQYIYDGVFATEPEVRTVLSLNGFAGSDNYLANKEWFDFEETYDPDQEILLSLDDYPEFPRDYEVYGPYTQEMKDKVDEIAEKYHLDLLGRSLVEESAGKMFEILEIPGILRENTAAAMDGGGYFFQSGTFRLDGRLTIPDPAWPHSVEFGYRCVRKTDFDPAWAGLRDLETCRQWTYRTESGEEVLLALNEYFALIVADQRDFFITVVVHNPKVGNFLDGEYFMEPATLETIAEAFDYSIHPRKLTNEEADDVEERFFRRAAEENKKAEEFQAKYEEFIGKESYDARITHLLTHTPHPERMGFALMDLDGNGVQELLVGQDGYISDIYTAQDGETSQILTTMGTIHGYIYLCENDTLVLTDSIDETVSYTYVFRIVDGKAELQEDAIPGKRVPTELTPLDLYPLAETPEPDEEYLSNLNVDYHESYAALIKDRILNPARKTQEEKLTYRFCLLDLNGDGQDELLFDEEYTKILYTMENGRLRSVLYGRGMTVCEDDVIQVVTDYSGGNQTVCYYRMEGSRAVLVDYLRYDADGDHPWYRSPDGTGQDLTLVPVSKTEFEAVRSQYPPMDPAMKPLEDYPLN